MGSYYLYEFPLWQRVRPLFALGSLAHRLFCRHVGAGLRLALESLRLQSQQDSGRRRTAEEICFELLNDGLNSNLLPADVDSPTPPPAGEDEFFIGGVNAVDNSHLSLYSMHINNQNDWSQGATFTGTGNSQLIAVAPYTSACPYPNACVPQLGTNDMLDDQGGLVMYRFAYWA